MQERLRRHSPLEDLGPLFGPEAQGRRSAEPAPPGSSPFMGSDERHTPRT
jgi:hypothetical protein